MREGLIAATLTGFMILVFLGSWRSTLIITVSIPLAVLSSLTALSLLGQTINVMTLGGLALAVGILVDDATVTIENINRHMEEHGEDILTAITRGAQEIMPPATVALFCICIAFVPLLALGGVAGYLFRPLAMAVVFAMIASYILTYTLVPTMAHFLLANQHRHSTQGGSGEPPPVGVFGRFQRGFEAYFERFRQGYLEPVAIGACGAVWSLPAGFVCVALLSLGLAPFLGQDFFPSVDAGAIKIHMRAPTGTRIEETTVLADQVGQKIRAIIPPDRLASVVDNIGLPVSGINLSYSNTGTIGVFDADILVTLREGATPTDAYVKALREQLPRAFPGTTFSFLPADMVSQILNFGSPAPIDVQIAGARSQGQPRLRNEAPGQDSPCSRNRRSAHPGSLPGPRAPGRLQPRIRRRRRPDRERRLDQPSDDPFGQHPDGPDLLAEPRQRRFLRRFGPDPAIRHRHARRPQEPAAGGRRIRSNSWAVSRPFPPSRSTRSFRITTSATS